jgi:hypothetical protein
MSNGTNKSIRSPSYPSMPLRDAVDEVAKIEGSYRSSPVDRENAAKLIGYAGLSGPANKALAALASYGLLERAGKGQARVTERARAILHPKDEEERKSSLRAAALDPPLFREIREHFDGLTVPPEGGVATYLHRQGFNPSAIRPAVKAFLLTMAYLEELGVTESHGTTTPDAPESNGLGGTDKSRPAYGGARVGDLVQWENQGTLRFETPRRVRLITDDGQWLAVDDSETGIPMSEVIVQGRAPEPTVQPPQFSMQKPDEASPAAGEVEWMRNRLGSGTNVRLMVKGDMGPREIAKLIKILEAQKSVLEDD